MKDYLNAIIILAVLSGIIKAFLSENSSGTKKYVSYLIGLVMVVIIISPFKDFTYRIGNIKEEILSFTEMLEFENNVNSSNSVIVNTTKDKVCKGLKDALIAKYGFDERDVYVDIVIDKTEISSIKITEVNIILTNKASWSNVDNVKTYMENLIGVKVNVTRK